LMMSLWDALRMNMMISYQELVRTFLNSQGRYLPAFDVLLSTYVPTIGSQKTLMIRTKRNINPAVAVLMVLTVSM
ncbi:hypothetical protein BOQ07_20380, partial [Klebsiella michiganensis]